ncbi:P-loop containing nucleoside triphosphate hydrolase protein, partial [Cantharellus anzutake]|uniref:P-loop containing nucleoside triphosphate hydrolase protein n=1 Tax=Cantharellus anzutake TaxID=1750568 RepID=UPI0019078AC7
MVKNTRQRAKPTTVEGLQHECSEYFGWRPCRWQSEVAFNLVGRANQISISSTGSGKSRVFWLPMIYESGLTIIVVPLKSLGQQLADESSREGFHAISEIRKSAFRTVVLSPEISVDPRFMKIWTDPKFKRKIDCVIVDEAHCVSQWGRDFRVSYLWLSRLRTVLGDEIPWYLTSATLHVATVRDVLNIIGLPKDTSIYRRSNDRPNIHLCMCAMKYTIASRFGLAFLVPPNAKLDDAEWVRQYIPQFLVYCNSRADTEKVAKFLRNRLPADARGRIVWYHSGMSEPFRRETIEAFEAGEILGICCTDACGMGLDLHRVKIVVQYRLPKKIDAMVQRFGRAGRDQSIDAIAILMVE